MAECRDLESLFAAYVDGEAAPGECAALDAHFQACPACRDRVAGELVVRDAVAARRDTLRGCASIDLRRRCAESVRPTQAPRPSMFARRSWVPLSMAATLLLAVAGVFIYGLQGGTEALAAQLAVDHVKCFEFASPPSIAPDAKVLGRQWLEARGWTVKVIESNPAEQLELLDVRRCISTTGLTAHMMYKWRGQPLSVYVLNNDKPRVGPLPQLVERFGQGAMIWSKGGRTYAVVTRGNVSEIDHLAQYVQRLSE